MQYDLIILGGGPAGYNAAIRASEGGLSVALIEKNSLGGVCLNEGCIPSKSLLYSAKLINNFRHFSDYGIVGEVNVKIDQKKVLARKDRTVRRLVGGISASLKNAAVTVLKGTGYIVGKSEDGIELKVGEEKLLCKKLLLCTGSVPVIPPIEGLKEALESGFAVTNKGILSLSEIPQSLTVIGGGVIGLEMAAYYAAAGSKVTVIEAMDKIAGGLDRELTAILQRSIEKQGVSIITSAKVVRVGGGDVVYEKNGEQTVAADKLLVSVGRRAVIDSFGLENVSVATEKGKIKTNVAMQTSDPDIYCAGDANGISMLAHTAYREGEVAVSNILGRADTIDYSSVPSVIYTLPEVGSVGESEESAVLKSLPFIVKKLPLSYSGRFVAECGYDEGMCKLLINSESNTLLGAHIIGSYASEIIVAMATLIDLKVDIDRIKKLIFPHPTVGETFREALFLK